MWEYSVHFFFDFLVYCFPKTTEYICLSKEVQRRARVKTNVVIALPSSLYSGYLGIMEMKDKDIESVTKGAQITTSCRNYLSLKVG